MSAGKNTDTEMPGFGEVIADEATLWRVMAIAERMVTEAEKRGAVKALRAMANEMAVIGQAGWAIRLQGHANNIQSGVAEL